MLIKYSYIYRIHVMYLRNRKLQIVDFSSDNWISLHKQLPRRMTDDRKQPRYYHFGIEN